MNKKILISIPLALILMNGCGLENSLKEYSLRIDRRVIKVSDNFTQMKDKFANSELAKELAIYVAEENLTKYFAKAKGELLLAKESNSKLKLLVKNDNPNDKSRILGQIELTTDLLNQTEKFYKVPLTRLKELGYIKDHMDELSKEKLADILILKNKIKKSLVDISKILESHLINKKVSDIKSEAKTFNKHLKNIEILEKNIRDSFTSKNISDINKHINILNNLTLVFNRDNLVLYKKMSDIITSTSTILFDMKEENGSYYHKYIKERNGNKETTDWIKISYNKYLDSYNNVGMTIKTKPYDTYEDDIKVHKVAPAGMAYVGDANYGSWKQDDNGISFFEFYGMYSMFNDITGNNRYTRSDYNDYNKNRNRNYYGSSKRKYGTFGSNTKKKYLSRELVVRSYESRRSSTKSKGFFNRNSIKSRSSTFGG